MRVRLAGVSLFVLMLVSLVHGAMQAPVLRGVVTDHQRRPSTAPQRGQDHRCRL